MRNIFCLLTALIFSLNAFCGSPDSIAKTKVYHVNYPVVGGIILVGMTSDFFAVKRIQNKPWISDSELVFLNKPSQKNLINSIDRWALKQNPSERNQYKKISDDGEVAIFLLPALLLFDKKISKDWLDLLLMYAEGHTITFTFYNYSPLGPTFINRYRPVTYYSDYFNSKNDNIEAKHGGNYNSFYSGHVASCTYSTFFMAKVYCDYHPDMGAEKYLWYIGASIPPLLIGYCRVKALDHFPSDVGVGFILGAAVGIVVPELHKYHKNKRLSLGMFSSPEGTGLSLHWKLQKQQLLTSGSLINH